MRRSEVSGYPGLLPWPPADLSTHPLPLVEVGPPWFRCGRSGRDPIHFGRTGISRFGDPDGAFGVLYAGTTAETAFIEVFGGKLVISSGELAARSLWTLTVNWTERLVDLTGDSLPSLGIDARIWAGEHAPARAWSRAFFEHRDQPGGILYRSRRDPSRLAIPLFEREGRTLGTAALPAGSLVQLAQDYGLTIK